ncbi:MAG: ATP-binding cassette domain-containing protein [Myxococcales bacterium]|nr:ATP-binding cassette domain-containing protein [Myxococcota bacterium]MDW8280227.1 ATP-binding cassette domain-containing protein [Myxococcales bacterium]
MSVSEMPSGQVLLRVDEVSLRLGGTLILDRVTFEVRDRIRQDQVTGQVVSLLGPSGVGKTRLLRILAGLDTPDAGRLTGPDNRPLPPGSVGFVFQHYPLLRHRTVLENLIIAGTCNGMTHDEARQRARQLLQRFQLDHRSSFYPAQLSGGQRQRVAIAQQLVRHKGLLLMDEPFSGLDPAALEDVMRLLIEVAHMHELNTIMVVTHDIRAALLVSDTVFMLGRDRHPDGTPIPGARIQGVYDLVARGLAWREDLEDQPAFLQLEREIKGRFRSL